jgi:transcriptional regulator with XRE-family HTH domain
MEEPAGNEAMGGAEEGQLRPGIPDLKEKRRQEGITVRTVARRLDIAPAEVKDFEADPGAMSVRQLVEYVTVLGLPMSEVFSANDTLEGFSTGVENRAALVEIMRTVLTMHEQLAGISNPNLRQTFEAFLSRIKELLTGVMPRLDRIGSIVGTGRRTLNDLGRAAHVLHGPGLDELAGPGEGPDVEALG